MGVMATNRVQVYTPNRVGEGKAQEAHRSEEGTGVAVRANYLPNIYQDGQDKGGQSGQQSGGDNQQLVQFLRGANTQQLRTLATNVKPTFSPHSPMSFIGPNAVPAAYAPKSKSEDNRRHWGDFLPGGTTRSKFLPIDGMPISFDANDRPINASVPREVLAQSTSVPAEMDNQVRSGLTEPRQPP